MRVFKIGATLLAMGVFAACNESPTAVRVDTAPQFALAPGCVFVGAREGRIDCSGDDNGDGVPPPHVLIETGNGTIIERNAN